MLLQSYRRQNTKLRESYMAFMKHRENVNLMLYYYLKRPRNCLSNSVFHSLILLGFIRILPRVSYLLVHHNHSKLKATLRFDDVWISANTFGLLPILQSTCLNDLQVLHVMNQTQHFLGFFVTRLVRERVSIQIH